MSGYVYVLSNESFKKCLKIGMTTRSLHERVRELSNRTAVPTPFIVQFAVECSNPSLLEKEVHRRLRGCRIEKNREFFRVDVYRAVKEIKEALGELSIAAYSSCGANKGAYLTAQECAEYQANRKAHLARVERVDYLFKYYVTGIKALSDIRNRVENDLYAKVDNELSGFDTNGILGFFLSPFSANRDRVRAEVTRRIPTVITSSEANLVKNFVIADNFVKKEGLEKDIMEKVEKNYRYDWYRKYEYGVKSYYSEIIRALEKANYVVSGDKKA